ncbi:hypothetical protein BIV57_01145 [Mangrovactinospora gilvigrisea]|uniref:Peptidase S53 domain-containing protein n=1 Tax=Mangrovactinospora gilvigrisea TaxID=1428644 RepID=A0A1J7BLJ0_9ACTN|nr:hypothetical protein [Mangrovactinospora gilvigrisea]OIV39469.1 hypothetical protein BIV57_01145 [Mangrovactinospora gilvigrisea]
MRFRPPGIRTAAAATVAALAAAALSVPAAHAATAQDAGSGHAVRLTPSALKKLSGKYTPRADGTPGLVAAARHSTSAAVSTRDAAAAGSGAKSTAAATGAAPSASTSTGFTVKSSWETPRGAANTLALGGTKDWAAIFSGGTVARYGADGKPVWQRDSHSLFADWQVKPTNSYQDEEYAPVLYQGYNPYQPSSVGQHPFAQADFNGDGTADIAVAYDVGDNPPRPFTTPGSDLHSGTFISILDGRTGTMLWHTLLPGTVGSLTTQHGQLIVADTTGPNWDTNPVKEQGDSRSSLLAYSFRRTGSTLSGKTAWTYSTQAPWALWSDVEPAGKNRIAAGWSDTPMGLGNPRPPAGHAVVIDTATGKTVTDTKTPGYPRMVRQSPDGKHLLVVEQNDPYDAVRWDLSSIDPGTGTRSVLATRSGTIPEAFEVNAGAKHGQAQYAVAELGINADLSDGQSTVSGWDAHGRTLWSHTTASSLGGPNAPTLSLTADGGNVYAAVADPAPESRTNPEAPEHAQLLAYAADGGAQVWHKDGAVVGDQITPYRNGLLTVGYDDTAYQLDPAKGTATAQPLLGDVYAAISVDLNGDGVKDLVLGGQSHGVFAVNGRSLGQTHPDILWDRPVSAAVRQLKLADVVDSKGRTSERIVAATSTGFAVLEKRGGSLDADVDTGTFQAGVAVAGGHVLASGDALGAYTADGKKTWSYRPAGTDGKKVAYAVPATADGRIYLEYGGFRTQAGTGTSDPAPTAVALDASDGHQLWSEKPTGDSAAWIEQQAGVYASPDIPGAGGHGVAFAFGGDKPAAAKQQVQIVNGATGTVVRSDDSVGSATFTGFTSSPTVGLVEMHTAELSVYPADGSAQYNVHTLAGLYQGTFAKTAGGKEVLAAGAGGILRYNTPLPNNWPTINSSNGQTFAQDGSEVHPLDLGSTGATDLIAVQRDWAAYNLSQNVGGYAANSSSIDHYRHGVAVLQASDTAPATTAKASKQSQAAAETGATSGSDPIAVRTLPVGHGVTSMHINKTVVVRPGTSNADETTPGYSPQQIRKRLGLTGDGSGQTVAISIAYDYPNARADLNHFAAHFNLPQTCDSVPSGTDCFDFQQVYADGTKPAADANWNEEAALDIEWSHAAAPKAKIILVEGKDSTAQGLYQAVDKAATYKPAAVNNSWGMSEFSEESFYDGHCKITGSVCTQSTGDAGYPANYSSTNPFTLAVGGTRLQLDADGNTTGETAWASTGGGLSYFAKRPAYQDGTQPSAYRATPDVSFDADPNTGVAVYTSAAGQAQWLQVGGTSLSSPIWAGILASTDQLRTADGKQPLAVAGPNGDTLHRAVYGLGTALSDVTSGSNGACGTECTAGTGYDTVTGLGSPLPGIDKALAEK